MRGLRPFTVKLSEFEFEILDFLKEQLGFEHRSEVIRFLLHLAHKQLVGD